MRPSDVLSLLGLLVLVASGASLIASTLRLGISPMPTSRKAREAMLGLIPPDTRGVVHELGAGWGGLALALSRHCREARVVAWERSPVPWAVARLRARLAGLENLEVRYADFLGADLSGASVLVCYLFTGGMAALDEKLRRELPGAAVGVVTNTFLLRGWTPEATVTVDDLHRSTVARYRGVPRPPAP